MKQRTKKGKLKQAEPLPSELNFRVKSRHNNTISTPLGSPVADRAIQLAREQAETSGRTGTPVKPSNVKYSGQTTRKEVVDSFAHELLDHRADLVDHVFDGIVSVSLAAKITLCFLHHGILSVKCGRKIVERVDWPAACLHATSLARLASKDTKVTNAMKQQYTWCWSKDLNTGTEHGAQQFLNIVGVLGYIFGTLFDLDLMKHKLRTRITTLPCPHNALPLPSSDGQDCRPDFIALHRSAFVDEHKREPSQEYLKKPSILMTIGSLSPELRKTYPRIFPSPSQKAETDADSDEERVIQSSSFTPGGCDELLEDMDNGKYTVSDRVEERDIMPQEAPTVAHLLQQLKDLLRILGTENFPDCSDSVVEDLKEYDDATFLDLSMVCLPNVLIAGEGKQTDMRAATVQAMVYMHQQRRTQPWLRFCLGLMVTKEKMGLLRADATGVEECIFSKNVGRGVIEAIRLSIGILLATDEELGQHPCFSLRSVETLSLSDVESSDDNPSATTGTKRPAVDDDDARSPKKQKSRASGVIPLTPTDSLKLPKRYKYREVDWITLDAKYIHGPSSSDEPPTTFYVKYLLEDRGSLIGRCTRVWCVYQEVSESDPILDKYRHETKGSRVFKGPYALKVYNCDTDSEAYEGEILERARKLSLEGKLSEGILLPNHVWYLGEILTLVRGLKKEECPPSIPSKKIKHREEIFAISPFKRVLSQFMSKKEFYGAIIGALRGIKSLEAVGIMHRDISFGNIILNDEKYTDEELQWIVVKPQDGQSIRVALIRREPVDIGTVGGLHDLDMASYVPLTKKKKKRMVEFKESQDSLASRPDRDWRTGTQPFMSIRILRGSQHLVKDDLQSVFFVSYLSLFTFNTPSPNCFPNKPPPLSYSWPQAVIEWSDTTLFGNMSVVGYIKRGFFVDSDDWVETVVKHALAYWHSDKMDGEDGRPIFDKTGEKFLMAFHAQLWTRAEDSDEEDSLTLKNPQVTSSSIIDALEEVMKLETPVDT